MAVTATFEKVLQTWVCCCDTNPTHVLRFFSLSPHGVLYVFIIRNLTENVNMNHNEEVPDFLGGLGDMLPAEVLKMLNEMLERLHQTDHINQGSKIEVIYVASGGQHVETQINVAPSSSPQEREKEAEPSAMPEALRTEEAKVLWEKVQRAGYVDDNYLPLISRTQSALLADAMAERLGIREKWKVFEALWNRKYMRSDYNLALTRKQSLDFQDELKQLFV